MKLFFDTETTGFVKNSLHLGHPDQPRIVQLAAILTDEHGKELSHFSSIIAPQDFEIPEEAAKVHGITTEYAKKYGINSMGAMGMFMSLATNASLLICHNTPFDMSMIQIELVRSPTMYGAMIVNLFKEMPSYCTMKESTNICKIHSARGGYKWPKLSEAYRHAFGKDFEGAHDAMADCRAMKELYFWLEKKIVQ